MLLENLPSVSQVIVSIAVMLLAGYLMSRVTKMLKLPNVTGYIVAGIIIGPYCLKIIPTGVVQGMSFLADIALAFIAFSTGEFFKLSTLKKNGGKNGRRFRISRKISSNSFRFGLVLERPDGRKGSGDFKRNNLCTVRVYGQ